MRLFEFIYFQFSKLLWKSKMYLHLTIDAQSKIHALFQTEAFNDFSELKIKYISFLAIQKSNQEIV